MSLKSTFLALHNRSKGHLEVVLTGGDSQLLKTVATLTKNLLEGSLALIAGIGYASVTAPEESGKPG